MNCSKDAAVEEEGLSALARYPRTGGGQLRASDGARRERASERDAESRSEASAIAVDAPGAGVNLPFLTGGLRQVHPLGRYIDFLTLSVPSTISQDIIAQSVMEKEGFANFMFAKCETWKSPGGPIHRRYEPAQDSKEWGKAYESWQSDGERSRWFADFMRTRRSRPSRLDDAFDFRCPASMTAADVAEAVRSYCNEKRVKIETSGDELSGTKYIGSKHSDRRIRIYRKDLQDFSYAAAYGPVIRIELILKGDHAHNFWAVFQRDPEQAHKLAAGHIFELSSLVVHSDHVKPARIPSSAGDIAKTLFEFARQWGPTIHACEEAGIDIIELSKDAACLASRATIFRLEEIRHRINEATPEHITDVVHEMIDAKYKRKHISCEKRREYASKYLNDFDEHLDGPVPY